MQISTDAIKSLREQTSAGLMDCKKALAQTGGDVAAAEAILRKKGFSIAEKKADRVATKGMVEAYIHAVGRIGALVEVNCESDFVARNPEFKDLAHDIAMQVAATNPRFITPEDAPEGDKPADEECLLMQPFIKDPSKTIRDLITESVAKFRENIRVSRFARFELGVSCQDAPQV